MSSKTLFAALKRHRRRYLCRIMIGDWLGVVLPGCLHLVLFRACLDPDLSRRDDGHVIKARFASCKERMLVNHFAHEVRMPALPEIADVLNVLPDWGGLDDVSDWVGLMLCSHPAIIEKRADITFIKPERPDLIPTVAQAIASGSDMGRTLLKIKEAFNEHQ